MSGPSPSLLADSHPWPTGLHLYARRAQVRRLKAELATAVAGSKAWHDARSRLIWAQGRLTRLEERLRG